MSCVRYRWHAGWATAAFAYHELDGEHDVPLRIGAADPGVENLERPGTKFMHRLAHGGQRWMQVPSHRHVVKTGDGDVLRHLDPPLCERVHDSKRGLVIGAHDRAWKLRSGIQERRDHVGPSRGAVVSRP